MQRDRQIKIMLSAEEERDIHHWASRCYRGVTVSTAVRLHLLASTGTEQSLYGPSPVPTQSILSSAPVDLEEVPRKDRAVPTQSILSSGTLLAVLDPDPKKEEKKKKKDSADPEVIRIAAVVVDTVNRLRGTKYRQAGKPWTDLVKQVQGRMQDEQATEADFILVIEAQLKAWAGTDLVRNVNPVTLTRPANFGRYLAEARAAAPDSSGCAPRATTLELEEHIKRMEANAGRVRKENWG